MAERTTDRAVADAALLETARRAARLAVEPPPRLDAVAAGIDLIRRELRV